MIISILNFQDCSHCQKLPCKELKEAIQELETLSSVICGGSDNPSLKKLSSLRRLDLLRCESEELLSKSTMGKTFSFLQLNISDLERKY